MEKILLTYFGVFVTDCSLPEDSSLPITNMFLGEIAIYFIIMFLGFQWPENFHYCSAMERMLISCYPGNVSCLSLLKLKTHCFYICNYLAPKCLLRRRAEYSNGISSFSYHITQKHFFRQGLQFWNFPWACLKAEGAERGREDGAGELWYDSKSPGEGGSPGLLAAAPHLRKRSWPFCGSWTVCFRTMVKFIDSWPKKGFNYKPTTSSFVWFIYCDFSTHFPFSEKTSLWGLNT